MSAQVLGGLVRQEGESLLVRVRGRFDLSAVAAACAGYHQGAGRQGQPATYPVARLLWCLLAGQLLGLSLRELEVTLRRDQLLRWFCGFALHEPTPDHSTLGRFAVWMQAGGTEQLFQAVLAQIVQDFPGERSRSQLGDTFALHARAADTERTALLRDVCGRLLRCLERACPPAQAAVLAEMGGGGRPPALWPLY